MQEAPILYSFRRCPYAMRARMALAGSQQRVRLREIILRDKPSEMIAASPKATVPVMVFENGSILEESLDIALWALKQADPQNWLPDHKETKSAIFAFLEEMDGPFKHHLDHTKYVSRYAEDEEQQTYETKHREAALEILTGIEERLIKSEYLFGPKATLADIATFPFVRQFANTDLDWWNAQPIPHVQNWLHQWIESPLFLSIMEKYPIWKTSHQEVNFPKKLGS